MRRILLWLLEDLRGLFAPHVAEMRHLRGGMARARQREAHHREGAREASERAGQLMRRIKALEMSREADVGELVEVRRELVVAEGDLRHHRSRARQAEEALRLMKGDRERLEQGLAAEHRAAYAELLNR